MYFREHNICCKIFQFKKMKKKNTHKQAASESLEKKTSRQTLYKQNLKTNVLISFKILFISSIFFIGLFFNTQIKIKELYSIFLFYNCRKDYITANTMFFATSLLTFSSSKRIVYIFTLDVYLVNIQCK